MIYFFKSTVWTLSDTNRTTFGHFYTQMTNEKLSNFSILGFRISFKFMKESISVKQGNHRINLQAV